MIYTWIDCTYVWFHFMISIPETYTAKEIVHFVQPTWVHTLETIWNKHIYMTTKSTLQLQMKDIPWWKRLNLMNVKIYVNLEMVSLLPMTYQNLYTNQKCALDTNYYVSFRNHVSFANASGHIHQTMVYKQSHVLHSW